MSDKDIQNLWWEKLYCGCVTPSK